VLSEEAPDSPDRLTAHRVWIVDPLDGTREYTEGRDDWGVQIALAVGGLPIVGAIALPASRRLLSTRAPAPVAYRSRRRTIVVSRSHTPAFARIVAERLDAELLLLGSAAAKTAAVLAGSADIYLHAGGMYEWDSAAPAAVAKAAGLHASRLDGRPLRYNQPDPYLPDLLICRPDLADAVLDAVPGCASP
jgi:3'(2'), 5'-bisphosphate nucleotidase